MNNTGKNYAIRLFALKDVNGDLRADCRINGEEYPEAEENLKKYAETWKKCDIIKFRKQYILYLWKILRKVLKEKGLST